MDISSWECFPKLASGEKEKEKSDFRSADRNNHEHTDSEQSSDVPSAIVQMDDEGLVSKLFKGLIMVPIHVSCVAKENTLVSHGNKRTSYLLGCL